LLKRSQFSTSAHRRERRHLGRFELAAIVVDAWRWHCGQFDEEIQ
jgi:hypothetical protein